MTSPVAQRALGGVSVDVARGERLAVLGPNGAGKTTLFNVIAGDLHPTGGTVTIGGVDCTTAPSRQRSKLGVSRTYQRTRLFPGLTVEDNLLLAWMHTRLMAGYLVRRLTGRPPGYLRADRDD